MAYQTQTSLFAADEGHQYLEPDITYIPKFLADHEAWFEYLRATLNWNTHFRSRKTATFGVSYIYKQGTKKAREMPKFLEPVCDEINQIFRYKPNNCLVNFYPDGNHYISFHSDRDTETKAQTGVTIISLGYVRTLTLKNIQNPQQKFCYPLQPGSAIFMEDSLQTEWQHGVLKEAGAGPRISLSFRALLSD